MDFETFQKTRKETMAARASRIRTLKPKTPTRLALESMVEHEVKEFPISELKRVRTAASVAGETMGVSFQTLVVGDTVYVAHVSPRKHQIRKPKTTNIAQENN